LSGKTIRKRLKHLRTLDLIYEPEKMKGYLLTAKGTDKAKGLPADAGVKFFRSAKTGR
jgi:hypothetical protein